MDGSMFCPACGAPVVQQTQNTVPQQTSENNFTPQQTVQPQQMTVNGDGQPYPAAVQAQPQRNNNKKLFIIIGAVALAVIIAVVLIIVLANRGGNSCSTVVSKMADAVNTANIDELMEVMPPDYVAYYIDKIYDGNVEDFKDSLKSAYDLSSSMDIKVDASVTDEMHCTDSRSLRDINDYYQSSYDAKSFISETAKCRVEFSVVYAGVGTPSVDTDTMYFVKIDGQWYVDVSGTADNISNSYYN